MERSLKKVMMLSGIVFLILLLAGCGPGAAIRSATPTALPAASPTPAPTLTPTIAPTTTPSAAYLAIFDTVWQTVNDSYFDPGFGGVDWPAERERYEPLVAHAKNDRELYRLLNQMLWKLGVSHNAVGPAGMWPSVQPVVWMAGKAGLDVRLLAGEVVVTRVEPDSPAERAGLRSGFTLTSIDGTPVQQIIAAAETELAPPYTASGRIDQLTRAVLGRIYGMPDTCVTIGWLDGDHEQHERCIGRVQRERPAAMEGLPLPPAYVEFEARRLEENIGYIRFNTFHPELVPELVAAGQSMEDTPGIIVDLRGNPGGSLPALEALAAQFVTEQTRLGTLKTRERTIEWVIQPADKPYRGLLIILIDRLSFSGSEWFSASMQALDRAVIVGVRSPGGVSGADMAPLPNGALLMYPVVGLIAADGTDPEGRGVIPNIEVELDRDLLLQGIDSQLEAAIDYINKNE